MDKTSVQCPGCGTEVPRPSEKEGGRARCPGCGTVWRPEPAPDAAPPPETPPEAAPPPRRRPTLARNRTTLAPDAAFESAAPPPEAGEPALRLGRATVGGAPALFCPACGVALTAGDRYCPQCGYNLKTGRFAHQEHQRRRRLAIMALFLILGGLLAAAFALKLIRLPDRWPRFRATASTETPTPPPTPRTEEEIAALAEAIAGRLRAQLDELHPPAKRGEPIELVLDDGRVLSGTFWGVSQKGNALVEVEGVMTDAPVKRLREESRARVDPEFREETIRARARRQAAEMGSHL